MHKFIILPVLLMGFSSLAESRTIERRSCRILVEQNQLDKDPYLERLMRKKGYQLVKYNVTAVSGRNRDGVLARRRIPKNVMVLNTQMRSNRSFTFSGGLKKRQSYKYSIVAVRGRVNPDKFKFLDFDDTTIGYFGGGKSLGSSKKVFRNDVLAWGNGSVQSDAGRLLDGFEHRAALLIKGLPNCDDGRDRNLQDRPSGGQDIVQDSSAEPLQQVPAGDPTLDLGDRDNPDIIQGTN